MRNNRRKFTDNQDTDDYFFDDGEDAETKESGAEFSDGGDGDGAGAERSGGGAKPGNGEDDDGGDGVKPEGGGEPGNGGEPEDGGEPESSGNPEDGWGGNPGGGRGGEPENGGDADSGASLAETEYPEDSGRTESYLSDEEMAAAYEENGKSIKRGRVIAIAVTVAVVAVALLAAGILVYRFTPSKNRADINKFFKDGENGKILIYNYEESDYKIKKHDENYYVENDFLKDNFTDKFYYDGQNDTVIYTTATEIYDIPVGELDYSINGMNAASAYPIALRDKDTVYISVFFAAQRCKMVYREYENPDRLVIVDGSARYDEAVLTDSYVVREKPDIKGNIVETASDGIKTRWMLTDSSDGTGASEWVKVRSEDGRNGYVRLSHTTGTTQEYIYDSDCEQVIYSAQTRDHDILLVWHAVYSETDNGKIGELLAASKGINTVSPTWYKVVGADGEITSMADNEYVDYIHGLGMEIWPLISDFTSTDENGWDETALLCNTKSRRRLIENIMAEISVYGYDGINIDFEKVSQEAEYGYLQFIRELSVSCRKAGVVLSVDNYVPRPYNMHYHRSGQGECADYVIVMGYDEHYSGGNEAGSVASKGFVDEGISETLKEVPANKLINGIPFYTRLWMESGDENGNPVLTSKSCGMDECLQIVTELGLETEWDDEVGQYVAKGTADGVDYSIWLEDEKSMRERIKIVNGYDIAGVAAWCLGFESDSVWDIIAGK